MPLAADTTGEEAGHLPGMQPTIRLVIDVHGGSGVMPGWIRLYRLVFGVIALVAVIMNWIQLNDPNFWRFFTNQSGLIAGTVLVLGAMTFTHRRPPLWWEVIRGSAVLMMLVTGLVYATLLGGIYNPFDGSHRWQSSVLHQLIPLVMVADMLIAPLDRRVPMWTISFFALYPLAWLGYTMASGARSGWYPYNFLDPAQNGGAAGVALTILVLITIFLLIAALIIRLGRRDRRGRAPLSEPGE